jgi:hypothetical protein
LNSLLCIAAISGLLDGEYCSQKTGTKPVQVQTSFPTSQCHLLREPPTVLTEARKLELVSLRLDQTRIFNQSTQPKITQKSRKHLPALPISNPAPAARETVYSYLSRLAATWRTDVDGITSDMGAPFKRFLNQEPDAFHALAGWANLTPQQMEEMRSWTGIRAGNVRMKFRGGLFVSRALRNPVIRGCPLCLRGDAVQHGGYGAGSMIMRGDWQLREVIICVRHCHPLVPLWKSDKPWDRYDIQARLREIDADIMSGGLDKRDMNPSAYDLWLDGRLQDGRDDTWLKGQSLFASSTFCRLLGQARLRMNQSEDTAVNGTTLAAGFDIARQGETAIRQSLDQIAQAATGALDAPNKAFGTLYLALNSNNVMEDGLAPFCHMLRECILYHWPVAPGEILLGENVEEWRLHYFVTAAK